MSNKRITGTTLALATLLFTWSCTLPKLNRREVNNNLPESFIAFKDTPTIATVKWRDYFSDENLSALIDSALAKNQELNIVIQELAIASNEADARKGEYLPFLRFGGGSAIDRVGEYTRYGAIEKQLKIKDAQKFPDPFSDHYVGTYATWELDIWKKLRNARKAALNRYLSSVETRNFLVTNLVAEIAETYYELMTLDNMLETINQNISIQSGALEVVKQQKEAGKVSQLAVNRFEAQLYKTKALEYQVKQRIIEKENRIHFLTANFQAPVKRSSALFYNLSVEQPPTGVPAQLLVNRPDIRRAEKDLLAAKLDVRSARANFLPSAGITAGLGFQSFKPDFLINPVSLLYNFAGDLMAPLVNRKAIKAAYKNAGARQVQAVIHYEQMVLNAYLDVMNQLNKQENFGKSYQAKYGEVETLNSSVQIANSLFNSARADYAEVLLTQRDALEAKLELTELKMKQLSARVNIYRALGGGWR